MLYHRNLQYAGFYCLPFFYCIWNKQETTHTASYFNMRQNRARAWFCVGWSTPSVDFRGPQKILPPWHYSSRTDDDVVLRFQVFTFVCVHFEEDHCRNFLDHFLNYKAHQLWGATPGCVKGNHDESWASILQVYIKISLVLNFIRHFWMLWCQETEE